ncbi:hypothetical protein FHR70_000689 [Microvirga lupini]|uniref:Uncharacterized protein n=1 Tax=Microvirga lupini TaxID=420324 RepID=A0A7W4VI57_9HYPH|nr:hypothetical protein [Microvirga lupini]MBB3017649.1 hypothetical protein [Microvirga lupini]
MSKTAQRRRSAYQNGYRVGRYGWPEGVKSYRVGVIGDAAYERGLRDGRKDRRAAQDLGQSMPRRVLAWLSGLMTKP